MFVQKKSYDVMKLHIGFLPFQLPFIRITDNPHLVIVLFSDHLQLQW